MIGKATVFAIVLLAPGIAFAADSTATTAAPAPAAHDAASAATSTKSDVKTDAKQDVKSDVKEKVVKAKTHHKAKTGTDAAKPAQKS